MTLLVSNNKKKILDLKSDIMVFIKMIILKGMKQVKTRHHNLPYNKIVQDSQIHGVLETISLSKLNQRKTN